MEWCKRVIEGIKLVRERFRKPDVCFVAFDAANTKRVLAANTQRALAANTQRALAANTERVLAANTERVLAATLK